MKIIIVGLGKVGQTLAVELSKEDNDITVIDNRESVVQDFASQYDIMGVTAISRSAASIPASICVE